MTDERYGCYTCGTIRPPGGPSCECPQPSLDWALVMPPSHYADDLRGYRRGRWGDAGIDRDLDGIDSALSAVRLFRDDLDRAAIFDDRYRPVVESADQVTATLEAARETAKEALRLLDRVQADIDALSD